MYKRTDTPALVEINNWTHRVMPARLSAFTNYV